MVHVLIFEKHFSDSFVMRIILHIDFLMLNFFLFHLKNFSWTMNIMLLPTWYFIMKSLNIYFKNQFLFENLHQAMTEHTVYFT